MPAENRSILPDLPGLPWWGALLLALGGAAAGIAIDALKGGRELTMVFAVLYVLGCLAAVLLVQQSGVFTAVVQPPLILFVAVPTAYFLFHYSDIHGIKDILINCGYPLIERFLLMFGTAVAVLLIGIARWYFGKSARTAGATTAATATVAGAGLFATLRSALAGRGTDDDDEPAEPGARTPRRHNIDRGPAAPAAKPARERRPSREATGRSRHARPPMDDPAGAPPEPPRRRRNTHARDEDDIPVTPPRRRRAPRDPEGRSEGRSEGRGVPREYRREPREYPRDPRPTWQPPEPPERGPRRPNRYESYEPVEAYEPPPTRAGGTSTHLPFSNVRYRGTGEDEERRTEHRRQPRARHERDSERWRYDR